MTERRESRLHFAFAIALTFAAACAFYLPALRATHGDWPAPLDDVFIHFDFARSWATGHPFAWIGGQGYSSGETSPLYSIVLAIGYAIGFRGMRLGVFGAVIATAAMVSLLRSIRALVIARVPPEERAWHVAIAWTTAPMFVAIGVVDWSWFSGMEVALFGALLGRVLVATDRARESPPDVRTKNEWRAAIGCALLVATRPEAIVVAGVVAVAIARRAGARSGWLAAARVVSPSIAVTLLIATINLIFTGETQSAGAVLKLLSSNPFLTDVARAREFVVNIGFVRWKLLATETTAIPRAWLLLPLLACASLASRRTRALGAACLASAFAFALLVSWNGAARFQNYRYYVPALVLVLVAASLGAAAIASYRALRVVAFAAPIAVIALALPRVPSQIHFFRDASANIHDQQVEVGRRLARIMPANASVLVGDAGAIAYVSEHHAIDALGLGGYRGLPFVRAATIGEASTVELIEHLAPSERPAYLALYPNWFGTITANFGHEIDRVTIDHNVICGGVSKVIYAADWSALDDSHADIEGATFDAIDVADVMSESEHAYQSPAPNGGWPVLDVRSTRDRARLFDGGRVIPEGTSERFVALHGSPTGDAAITIRIDDSPCDIDVDIARTTGARDHAHAVIAATSPSSSRAWRNARAIIPSGIAKGDAITITARSGALHDFHVWLASNRDAVSAE